MFKDKEGKLSSKRVLGTFVLCYTVVMATLGAVVGSVDFGIESTGAFLGLVTALLVSGVAERRK